MEQQSLEGRFVNYRYLVASVALVLLVAGCGGDTNTVPELEQRIAELEAERESVSAAAPDVTNAIVATTTTTPPTTTTTLPPTTTTTLVEYDWSTLTYEELGTWDVATMPIEANYALDSCLGGYTGFTKMSRLLYDQVEPLATMAIDATEGRADVAQTSIAWTNFRNTAILVAGLAKGILQLNRDHPAEEFITALELPLANLFQSAGLIGAIGFKEDGTYDLTTLELWVPIFLDGATGLANEVFLLSEAREIIDSRCEKDGQ